MTTPLLHAGRRKRALPSSSPNDHPLSRNPLGGGSILCSPPLCSLRKGGGNNQRRRRRRRSSATGEGRTERRSGRPFCEVTGRNGRTVPRSSNFTGKQCHLFHPGEKGRVTLAIACTAQRGGKRMDAISGWLGIRRSATLLSWFDR